MPLLATKAKNIFLLISFSTLFIYAQDADSNTADEEKVLYLSLEEAKDYALNYHPNVRLANIDVELAKQQIRERKSIGLPQINANAELLYNPIIQEGVIDFGGEEVKTIFGRMHNFSAGVSIGQLAFDASYFVGLKLAEVYSNLTELEAQKTALDTQYDIEQTYLSALISTENIELLEKNLPTLERILFETAQLFENGFAESIETDRIKLSKSNIETQIRNLREQERLAIELLRFQMGYPTQEKIVLTDSIDTFMDFNIEYLDSLYFNSRRIEYDILDKQKEINELQIDRTKAQFYPTLAGFAEYGWISQREKFFKFKETWSDNLVMGLSLNIPIYDGGMKRSQIQTTKLNLKKIAIGREVTKMGFDIEIKSALTNYQTALEEKLNQEKNLALAEKIYNTGLIKYREGLGSSLEVNSSESTFLQTQASYINSLYSLVLAKAELNKAYGNY